MSGPTGRGALNGGCPVDTCYSSGASGARPNGQGGSMPDIARVIEGDGRGGLTWKTERSARLRSAAGRLRAHDFAGEPLARSELPIDTASLARYLVGKILVRALPEGTVSGRIVETEAYVVGDAAGHAYGGMTRAIARCFSSMGTPMFISPTAPPIC